MVKTLISTLNEGSSISVAAHKLAIDKLVILVSSPISSSIQQQIDKLKNKYDGVLELTIFPTSSLSLKKVVEDVVNIIDAENRVKHQIILHISLVNIPQSLGIIYAAYVRPESIEGLYAVLEDSGEIILLPLLNLRLEGPKRSLMLELKNGERSAKKIANKLRVNQSMIYAHLKDLQKKGLINKSGELTDNGYIAVL